MTAALRGELCAIEQSFNVTCVTLGHFSVQSGDSYSLGTATYLLIMRDQYVTFLPWQGNHEPWWRAGRITLFIWSSAKAHIAGENDALVDVLPMLQRVPDWKAYLPEGVRRDRLKRIRDHEISGLPLGDDHFVRQLERRYKRTLVKQKPGPKCDNLVAVPGFRKLLKDTFDGKEIDPSDMSDLVADLRYQRRVLDQWWDKHRDGVHWDSEYHVWKETLSEEVKQDRCTGNDQGR